MYDDDDDDDDDGGGGRGGGDVGEVDGGASMSFLSIRSGFA